MAASTAAEAQHNYALQRYGLVGRKCLVTGGTKGIGRAVVEEFARLGAEVFTCSRNQAELDAALADWRAQGFTVHGCAADVSQRQQCQQLLEQVSNAFGGRLDVLVNNVGSNIRKPTVEYSKQEFDFLMSTNIESAFALCQLFHPLLKAAADTSKAATTSSAAQAGRHSPCVVFNSSVAGGPLSLRSGTLYAMSKAAMNQLARNLAVEWAADGIRVNAVCPWYTATPLALQVLQDKEYEAGVLERTPIGRVAEPQEVAGVMAFLCSAAASYVTGQTWSVDGGYSVKGYW